MQRTPVYIVCSPRPRVGKTLLSRLLLEFLDAQHGTAAGFDVNMSEPSLVDYLPRLAETADLSDTRGEIALMDRLIVHDGIPKVIDLGYPSFENFFRMIEQTGFFKEAPLRSIEPVVLFIAGNDRASPSAFSDLQTRFPGTAIVAVDNEAITLGDLPRIFADARPVVIHALPGFLKSIIDRTNFSFAGYLRGPNDPSAELHQWIRRTFVAFRELELNLILHTLR